MVLPELAEETEQCIRRLLALTPDALFNYAYRGATDPVRIYGVDVGRKTYRHRYWSQADLAQHSGVSEPTVARLESVDGRLGGREDTAEDHNCDRNRRHRSPLTGNGGAAEEEGATEGQ
jgi:hypothetical protein